MTVATVHLDDATLTKTVLATTFDPARPLAVPGALRRAALAVGDLLALTPSAREDDVLAIIETG